MHDWLTSKSEGFTLVDALVGLAFVSAITAGLANLVVIAIGLTRDARDDTAAAALAVQKVEQLRSSLVAGAALTVSPANALDEDVPSFSDRVNASGETAPAGRGWSTVYVRRWQIASFPLGTPSTPVVKVRV